MFRTDSTCTFTEKIRTDGQPKNIMPPALSVRRHKNKGHSIRNFAV